MEPDYIITENGIPDILLRQRMRHDKRLTDVKKFQHKNRCRKELKVVEVEIETPIDAKSMKNLQNERLKSDMDQQRRRIDWTRDQPSRASVTPKTGLKLLRQRPPGDLDTPTTLNCHVVEPS